MIAYVCFDYMLIYIIVAWAKPIACQNWFSLNDKMDKVFINIIMLKEKGILIHLIIWDICENGQIMVSNLKIPISSL